MKRYGKPEALQTLLYRLLPQDVILWADILLLAWLRVFQTQLVFTQLTRNDTEYVSGNAEPQMAATDFKVLDVG